MMIWSWVMALVLAGIVPLLSWRSARVAEEADLPRPALYLNACLSLWILAALGYLALKLDGLSLPEVGVRWEAGWGAFAAWSAGLTAAGLAIFAAGLVMRRAGWLPREGALLQRMRPRTAGDAVLVALVLSPSAGICEEFLYRGFLFTTIERAAGSGAAVIAGAAVFGLAHIYQGWIGAARAALIGLLLAAAPAATGSIGPAIAAHALVDALGILVIWPLLERARPAGA